jgi:D-xylose transport system substrate-binding protein
MNTLGKRDSIGNGGPVMTRQAFLRGGAGGLLAFMAGMQFKAAQADAGVKVGFILPDFDQLRWRNADFAGFESEAKKLGLTYFYEASQASETVQASQVENMLTRGVDVLILTPVNGAAAAALVRKANRAKVPVVDYNFLALNSDVACFIGRDAVQMAESIAQAAVKQAPTGNYILALGEESTSVAQEERKGYLNVIKPFVDSGKIQIVSEQFNKGWSTESARAQVENALTKVKNDVAAVVCANDGTAYGAIQALQAQGLAGKVFVNGVDAEPRAQELIRQGLMTLSNFTDFWQSGVEAAGAAVKLAKGEKIETGSVVNNGLKDVPWIKVINFNVTKENIDEDTKKYPWWFATSAMK